MLTTRTACNRWILLIIPIVAALVMFLPAVSPPAEGAPDPHYIDEDGVTHDMDLTASPVLSTTTTLTAGQWYVDGTVVSDALTVDGDVVLIICDSSTLTAGNVSSSGITVPAGCSLTVYPQSVGIDAGKLTSRITLAGGGFKNIAFTEYATTPIIINAAGSTVTNYGTISSTATGDTISASANAVINNEATEFCRGIITGIGPYIINSTQGCTINNSGTIENTHISYTSASTIYMTGSASTINNNAGGLIQCTAAMTIYLSASVTITNSGKIIASPSAFGDGIYTNGAACTIENKAGGLIQAGNRSIYPSGVTDCSIINYGDIICADVCIEIRNTTNKTLENYGTITSPALCMYTNSGAISFTNAGTINGDILLANAANHVTFGADSVINGNFDIGTAAGCLLDFVGDLDAYTLTYCTISGDARIGQGASRPTVSIDVAGLPPSLQIGDTIILIDGSTGTMTGSPNNSTFTDGSYSFDISVDSNRLIADVTAAAAIYGIELSETSYVFSSATEGYPPQTQLDITVTNVGNMPTGDLNISISGDVAAFNLSTVMLSGIAVLGDDMFAVTPADGLLPGTYTATITVDSAVGNPIVPVSLDVSFTVSAVPAPTKHTITATAGTGTTISPKGAVTVPDGAGRTFHFSAEAGYAIAGVAVDGKLLSQKDVGLGYYTFLDVHAEHTIEVFGRVQRTDIILTIDVMEGEGHAEYSVNSSSFARYTTAVVLPEHADITVRAFADDGYVFKEWRHGSTVHQTSGVSLSDLMEAVHLELYFAEDGSGRIGDTGDDSSGKGGFPLWAVGLLLLIIAGFLLWFIFYYRRSYEVIKVESGPAIVGKDRARRKRAYTFLIEGSPSGTVSYRVGEDGERKPLSPNEKGEYVIPGRDVIDKLTIEHR